MWCLQPSPATRVLAYRAMCKSDMHAHTRTHAHTHTRTEQHHEQEQDAPCVRPHFGPTRCDHSPATSENQRRMAAKPAGRCAWAALYGNEPLRVLKEKLLGFVAGACKEAAAEKSAFCSPPAALARFRFALRCLCCTFAASALVALTALGHRVQACAGTV